MHGVGKRERRVVHFDPYNYDQHVKLFSSACSSFFSEMIKKDQLITVAGVMETAS